MKKKVGTINCPPTPTGYAIVLIGIIECGSNVDDIRWAKEEIIKAFRAAATLNPKEWGKEKEV